MKDSDKSRQAIISKLKKSMEEGRNYSIPLHDLSTPAFPKPDDLLTTFCEELKSIGGEVHVCNEEKEIASNLLEICKKKGIDQLFCIDNEIQKILSLSSLKVNFNKDDLENTEVSITGCEYLVSRTGSVVVSSNNSKGRRAYIYPPIHIIIAKKSQIVPFVDDALELLEKKYGDNFPSFISFITGASRTADIEKTLVMGAHGPKELFVFINKNE